MLISCGQVLLEEIASLRRTADKQNEILRRLMAALDSRDLQNGHSREISQVRREDKDSESDEEQFALGGEDDEESDE